MLSKALKTMFNPHLSGKFLPERWQTGRLFSGKRKSQFVIIILLLIIPSLIYSATVNIETAKQVAMNWYLERNVKASNNPEIVETFIEKENSENVYYFFNFGLPAGGFVLVAADDAVFPILGYNFEHEYSLDNHPPQFDKMLASFKEQIVYVKENNLLGNEEIRNEWSRLNVVSEEFEIIRDIRDVSPLLSTNWDQGYSWNTYCPADPYGPGGYVYAGCVAVAMAQVMKYWAHPTTGTGSHGYYSDYGYLYVDFGATTYDWSDMYNSSPTNATRELLYHCGVSVNMDYGPYGSGAYTSQSVVAFETYFGYDNDAIYRYKNNYSSSVWESMLREELDNGRPLVYRGENDSGHAFNLDGYEGTDHFHINWGWSGYYNGYYYLNDLTPGGYNFTSNQAGIFNLHPEPSITVTSPNGGENWAIGSTYDITWTSENAGSSVSIKLYQIGSYYATISSSTPNNGTYIWTISTSYDESDYYKIKITDAANSSVYDYSDDYFTLYLPDGTIEGTVILNGGSGNVEDVEVTANGITVNPEANGDYSITIAPGNYDVTASLAGYINSTITDVEVLSGEATTDIDFILNPEGELSLLLPIDAEGCPGSQVSIPLTLDNPEEIAIEGIDVVITFNEGVIDATGATLTGGVLENEDYGFFANTDVPGEITLVFYALSDLFSGSGVIAYLEFDVVGSEGEFTDLVFSFAQVNEASVTVNDGYFTVIPCDFDIEGNIGYYSNASPIPNAELELTGDGTYSTTTNTSGDYIFNDIPGGNYVSTPSKADDLGGLSGMDASRIARYAADLYSFDCFEMIAGDVSINSYISGMDASRVARYAADLITELNDDGIEWVFTPDPIPDCAGWPPIVYESTRDYSPLELDLTDEDFIGIRLGDVSGNWAPDSRVTLSSESFEAIEFDTNINSIMKIPIVIENVTPIEGIDIVIAFDSEMLHLTDLTLKDGILEDKNYAIETNLKYGKMVIYALSDLVSETGTVAFIEFDVIGTAGSKTDVYFTKFDVNETEASGGLQLVDSEGAEIVTRRLEVNVVQLLPDKFTLYPNYPNPFDSKTVIRYDLPKDAHVNIQIYNVRGQLVEELVNGFVLAGSRKQIEWDAEGMGSGIYFYKLSTKSRATSGKKNYSQTKKLLLLSP